jgi:hypothetical protein
MIMRAAKRMGVVIKVESMPEKPYTTKWQLKEFGEWNVKPKAFPRNGNDYEENDE